MFVYCISLYTTKTTNFLWTNYLEMSGLSSHINGNLNSDSDLDSLLTRKQRIVIPSAPKCPKCNKSVFKAEEVRAANQIFHKLCFKCSKLLWQYCPRHIVKIVLRNTKNKLNTNLLSIMQQTLGVKHFDWASWRVTL